MTKTELPKGAQVRILLDVINLFSCHFEQILMGFPLPTSLLTASLIAKVMVSHRNTPQADETDVNLCIYFLYVSY
jgi:hypothetical protein